MKKVFISYRRTDEYDTRRIAKYLKKQIGDNRVFLDREMTPGQEWPESIKSALNEADIMFLIIGPNWLHWQDEKSGKRRIDMSSDWVRQEINAFLKRREKDKKLLLIPLLVNNAEMPKPEHLDSELSLISKFQYEEIPNTGKTSDFEKLGLLLLSCGLSSELPLVETPRIKALPKQLTTDEEEEFCELYPDWIIIESDKSNSSGDVVRELYRFFEFKSYEEAWKFICKVDEVAIRPCNHHPRWQNTYNRVEFWLCTFNIGHKPSARDIQLAKAIETIWKEFNID